MSTRQFLDLLGSVQGGSGKWTARCPAHDDHRSSLSVTEAADGEPIVHCHAGCGWSAVFNAVSYERPRKDREPRGGYSTSRREVAIYPYTDAGGAPLYEVVRYDPKDFRQRRALPAGGYEWRLNGVPRVPFHLPALITTVQAGGRVYVVEGEKDVLALEALGLTATTNAGGAEKWDDAFAVHFAGADVVILPDNDEPGRKHAARVARSVLPVAASVRVVTLPDLPPKGDVSDWIAAGGSTERLAPIVDRTAVWRDAPEPSAPKLRYYTLGELVTRPELLAEPDPVVPPFLFRGRVTLLAGREKLGKSTLVAHAAAALSLGEEFLGATMAVGRVLWYSLDEGLNDTVRRFLALEAAHHNVVICPDRPTSAELAEKLAEYRPDLVVFDTLNELLPGMDLNRGEQTAPALRPYVQVLRAANVAGCILCHASKGRGEYLGDVRIGGVVDATFTLKDPKESATVAQQGSATGGAEDSDADGPRVLVGKSRWAGKLHLRLTSPDGWRYVLGDAPLALDVRLLRALQDADLSANDLQGRVGGNRTKVLETLRELQQRGLVEKSKQRLRITPAGLALLDVGVAVVPSPHGNAEAGTTRSTAASLQSSAMDDDGTSLAIPGTSAEPAHRKWFLIVHPGVCALEPLGALDDAGDAGPIGVSA